MENSRVSENRSYADNGNANEAAVNQPSEEVVLGDVIWVSLHGSSWWPAQVVDDNTVAPSKKPRNRSVGDVLARLYGSYKYIYVDPIACRTEFQNILKQNNGNYSEIFKKALEKDFPCFKSGTAKGNASKSQEVTPRRMKVMQRLGLIAPSGSPFHQNGYIDPNLSLCS